MPEAIELINLLRRKELLKRWHQGKLIFPSKSRLPKKNFRMSSLIAFGETGLRCTANGVAAEVLLHHQGPHIHPIAHPR